MGSVMEFITESGKYVIKYSSILDMMESVRDTHWINKEDMPSHLDYNSYKWLGCSSYNEVDRLTTEGWGEGLIKMEDAIGRLELSRAMDIRRKKKWGASGSAINIHKVYAGKCHKAWMKMKRQVMIRVRKVTMYVDICANCNRTAEVMFWKGAAATILADALELAGYSVRIIGYMRSTRSFRKGYREIEQYVTLKEYGSTIDKTVLATGTGLSGFFRKYFFQGMGLCPERLTWSLGSHGYIYNFEKEIDELVVKLDDIWSLTDAKRAVDRVINELQEANIKVA
jgi:hypothetical protein